MNIHPTAIIDPKAELADDVEVGPYSIIGPEVKIGASVHISAHCVIEGDTQIGEGCRFFTGAVVGSITQDKKFKNKKSRLQIGKRNTIREYATLNLGTEQNSVTNIGDDNLIMAYAHIAHDCRLANKTVIANGGTLAGYVTVEDQAVVGGLVGLHQFVRVGRLAIIGGCSKATKDVPPFALVDGHPAQVYGINSTGLARAGISPQARAILKKAFFILFKSGLATSHAIERIKRELPLTEEVSYLLKFIEGSKRGICI